MDKIRNHFDNFYDTIKNSVFRLTKNDPENAHKTFKLGMKLLEKTGIEDIILEHNSCKNKLDFELSNAAGFNKNGEIHPKILNLFGFDRVNIGTVTHDKWDGNPRPRIWRYPLTKSLVNNMGLPGEGSKNVKKRIIEYGDHNIPLTISLMSTPLKTDKNMLNDLRATISDLKFLPYVDRFELNISCPNTHSNTSNDTRIEYMNQLHKMLDVTDFLLPEHELYLKLSPDSTQNDIDIVFDTIKQHKITGFTTANTTKHHDKRFIDKSPQTGGGSGRCVYDLSYNIQKYVEEKIIESGVNYKIDICGGIDSINKIRNRTQSNLVNGVQIFTPFIFEGTKYLKNIKKYYN